MNIHFRSMYLAAALSFAVTATPFPADAELYRCIRPDGSTVYTDNPGTCPGSEKHEPDAAIQTIQPVANPPPADRMPTRSSYEQRLESEKAQKAHWQQRKRVKEEELRKVEARHEHLGKFVTACNRGKEIVSKDEFGIKRGVSCNRIRREFRELEAKQVALREYLEEEFPKECRRAGCLPGWIR